MPTTATKAVKKLIDEARDELVYLTQDLVEGGGISLKQWQKQAAEIITTLHSRAGVAGYGHKLDDAAREHVNSLIAKQIEYLFRFAGQVSSGNAPRDNSMLTRIGMYADAANATYQNSKRGAAGDDAKWERRVLGPTEHCQDCLDAAALGWQPRGTLPKIGESQCLTNCGCEFEFSSAEKAPEEEPEETTVATIQLPYTLSPGGSQKAGKLIRIHSNGSWDYEPTGGGVATKAKATPANQRVQAAHVPVSAAKPGREPRQSMPSKVWKYLREWLGFSDEQIIMLEAGLVHFGQHQTPYPLTSDAFEYYEQLLSEKYTSCSDKKLDKSFHLPSGKRTIAEPGSDLHQRVKESLKGYLFKKAYEHGSHFAPTEEELERMATAFIRGETNLAELFSKLVSFYSDDQPRDEDGKWTATGGEAEKPSGSESEAVTSRAITVPGFSLRGFTRPETQIEVHTRAGGLDDDPDELQMGHWVSLYINGIEQDSQFARNQDSAQKKAQKMFKRAVREEKADAARQKWRVTSFGPEYGDLNKPLPHPDRLGYRKEFSADNEDGQWITIGASGQGDEKGGGTHVFIKDGRITKGAPGLVGRKIDALKEPAEEQSGRAEKKQSAEYDRARWGKRARQEGLNPRHLHQLAADMLAHDAEANSDVAKMLQEARKISKARDIGDVTGLAMRNAGGNLDPSKLKGFDLLTRSMMNSYPHILGTDAEKAESKLFDMLVRGNPQKMTESEAYEQAFNHLAEHGSRAGKEKSWAKKPRRELEEAPFAAGSPAILNVPDIVQHDHYSCILPGQELQGRVIGGSKARYTGQTVEFKTVSGAILSVTPNHPILTVEGFVPAGQLKKGQSLLHYVGKDEAASASNHKQHAPAVVEKVFGTLLNISGVVFPVEATAFAFDFHGDAKQFDGNIQVVGSYSKLTNNVISEASKRFGQGDLVVSGARKCSLQCGGGLKSAFQGSNATPGRLVGGSNLPLPVGLAHSAPHQAACFGPASELNAALSECAGQSLLPDAVLASKLLEGDSGQIFLDEIVEIRNFHYSGPVYDFESPLGWIVVNNVCISNCGAAATMCVGRYFGVGPATLEEWKKLLGTNVEQSTRPAAIVEVLQSLGLSVEARDGLTLEDLRRYWLAGMPVICPVQDYGPEVPAQAKFAYGHYLTVIGVNLGLVFCQDSSEDNVTRKSGSIQAPGRVMIEESKFLDNWHDKDIDGNKYIRYGIAVARSSKMAK